MTIDEKLLDLDLISIEDYSVRGTITPALYEKALEATETIERQNTALTARTNKSQLVD